MTTEEIAKALGVSKSTVSRALSGKGRIGAETRERIRAYVAGEPENGIPSPGAGRNRIKTGNIGVVIPTDAYMESIPYFQECLLGISEAVSREDYNVIITTGTAGDYSGAKKLVEKRKVDGMILMRCSEQDLSLDYLTGQEILVGLTGSCDRESVIQADSDNSGASRKMTSMLINCGYRRFALIIGNASYCVNQEREEGFWKAAEHYGLKREQQLCYRNFTTASFLDAISADLLAGKTECIICGDDVICSCVMSRLQAEGYRIPYDIAVASLYNSASLDCFTPAVTTVNISAKQLGLTLGTQMVHCLEGKAYSKKVLLDYEILFRRSAGKIL